MYTLFKVFENAGSYQSGRIWNQFGGGAFFDMQKRCGKAIAIGRLVHCRPMLPEDEDKCFVKYNPDLFCHIYEDVRPIEPISWRGK